MSLSNSFRIRFTKALVSVLLFVAFVGEPLLANPVLVLHGDETAVQGLARREGATCRILTLGSQLTNGDEVRVVGTRGSHGNASFDRVIHTEGDSLAIFTVTAGTDRLCNDDELAVLQAVTETTLILRNAAGGLDLVPVATLYESDRVIGLASRGEVGQLDDRVKGALVMEQGLHKGLLTTLDSGSAGRLATARHMDSLVLVEELGPWIRLPAPLAGVDRALEVLGRASEARPTGDIGQVAAVEKLVRQGSELSGMDLAGLSLGGASLAKARLSKAALAGVSFERTVLEGADLSEARLDFAELREARFEGAKLAGTRLYFAVADDAVFDGLKGASSNWTAASARDASFRNADLRGASFKFADLSGADFTGANLTETLLIGAILTGADFTGATLSNTDLTSAHGDATMFSPQQRRELCATPFSHHGSGYVQLTRVLPSTRFDSGKDFQQIAYGHFDYEEGLARLDPCKPRQHRPAGFESVYSGPPENIKSRYDFQYSSALLDVGGRRDKFIARFRDQLRRLEEAVAGGRFVEVPGEVRQSITQALERNLNDASPRVAELPFDEDSIHLLALRRVPGYADSVSWELRARLRFDDETRFSRRGGEPPVWPRFFPESYSKEQLSPEHVQLFRRWTLARAQQVPELFRLSFTAPRHIVSSSQRLAEKYLPAPPPSVAVVPLSVLPLKPLPQPLEDRLGPGSHGFLFAAGGYFSDLAVVLDQPLERYRLDVPLAIAEAMDQRAAQLELRLRIEDLDVVEIEGARELDHKTYAVLRSELVGMRLVAVDGEVAHPAELPRRGTHPLVTLRQAQSRDEFLAALCALYDVPASDPAELRRQLRPDISDIDLVLRQDRQAEQLETQQRVLREINKYRPYSDIVADYFIHTLFGAPEKPLSHRQAVTKRILGQQPPLEQSPLCP